MKKVIYLLLALPLISGSCDKWVEEAETPNNTFTREQLDKATSIANVQANKLTDGPMTAYVKTLQGEASAAAFLVLGAMTDELAEGAVPNVLLYRQIVNESLTPSSGTQNDLWNRIHNYYARSIELTEVADNIPDAAETGQSAIARAYGNYIGHLHAGYALQLLAACFSTTPQEEGGSVVLNGKLIPHETLHAQAKEQFDMATDAVQTETLKNYKPFDNEAALRIIATYKLRLAMHQKDYRTAAALARQAINDDESVAVIYNNDGADNPLYSAIGPNARDVQVSPSLEAARTNNAEKQALPLAHAVADKKNPNNYNIYASALTRKGVLTLTDKADIHFIRAELIVRGVLSGDAMEEANKIIGSYNAADKLTAVPTLQQIAALRRIYLAVRGERTADIRRGLEQGEAEKRWQQRKLKYLPLPERELQQTGLLP